MKKLIDANGRLFGRISVIDVAVILVVVVMAIALNVKFTVLETPMDTIEYTLHVEDIPMDWMMCIREGDPIYINADNNKNPAGVVTSLTYEDCIIRSTTVDGAYVYAPIDTRYNMTLTVRCDVREKDGRILLNGSQEIGVGSLYPFYTKACSFTATVWGIG